MKQYLYVFVLLLIAGGAHAALPHAAALQVEILRYEPVPAQPGDTITVWLQLSNDGSRAAENVVIELSESYPFTPASAADRTVTVGTLASQSQYVTSVNVAIDRSASQGEFTLPLTVQSSGVTLRQTPTIGIETGIASVGVQDVTTTPEELVPGSRATVQVTVQNVEQSLVRDLSATLDLTDSVFAPLGGSAQQKIASLDGGQEHTFTFVLLTEPDAASSVYKLPLTLNFSTTTGERRGQQEVIGLVVRAEPELNLVVDEAEVYKGGEGTVLLRLINKGLSEVKFVDATILDGEGYDISGSARTLYVGNIESDDFETVEYTLTPTADEFTMNVVLRYRDSLNNNYEETVQVPLHTMAKPAEAPSMLVLLLIAVLVVGGFIWWRRSRRGRK